MEIGAVSIHFDGTTLGEVEERWASADVLRNIGASRPQAGLEWHH